MRDRLVALLSGVLIAGVVMATPANASGTLTGVPAYEGSGIQDPALVGAEPVQPGHKIEGFAGIGVQSIIGPDNRVRVNPTTNFPARATVLITRTSGGTERQHCTGWMFGASLVLTAGHCVWSGSAFYEGLKFYPGYNGDTAPYGSCTATTLRVSNGYRTNGSADEDYGGAKLNCTIGNTVGWYGAYATTASLNGTATTIQGYGGDKNKQQWLSTDQIRTSGTLRLYYQNDTVGGNSGSAVATNRPAGSAGCEGWCALAFHAYGGSQNSGARVTAARLTEVTGWR
nr:trypsin-like serine protease [Kibdelosporangium sp. MJ126-NF4]CEL15118.1 Glutamyl endopeptidase precursor, blaSE [Kibdelosporangium sp. MJ126-NF4]CTQ93286.1 Glutamyl endopeptidase precursor (EC 3.4.21.19), blaSE [Kibdelosporangium sp. MJ126-NF4]